MRPNMTLSSPHTFLTSSPASPALTLQSPPASLLFRDGVCHLLPRCLCTGCSRHSSPFPRAANVLTFSKSLLKYHLFNEASTDSSVENRSPSTGHLIPLLVLP